MWVMQSLPQDAANLDCLPFEVAFLAFVPLFSPAGPSAHAPAASLSVQKTSAIPAGVAVFPYNQLPTKNSSFIKSIQITGVEKDSFFYTCFNFMGLLDSPIFSVIVWPLPSAYFCQNKQGITVEKDKVPEIESSGTYINNIKVVILLFSESALFLTICSGQTLSLGFSPRLTLGNGIAEICSKAIQE
ncbi:hypothetical protein MHB48_07375 [Psychrobacillus sp. FSL H8-0483]|uniref:hypothetical protein n=1 Tax=Psychrobacillus sp. FSL H8-0483 TaxID=2921389 RepID=UPI00315AC5C6